MPARRIASLALVLLASAAGCTQERSSAAFDAPSDEASPVAEGVTDDAPVQPLPTIRLDRPLDVGGVVDGGAGRSLTAPVIGVEASADVEVDTVVMIGDSITVAATPALEARFARLGFDEPVIIAQVNKRIAQPIRDNPSGAAIAAFLTADDGVPGVDAGAADPGKANELWIVALGTNDLGQSDVVELQAAVDEVLSHVPADAPLVWVDTYHRDRPESETRVNDVIRSRIAARGNAVVAPWSFFAGGDGVLRSDGVHPSDVGAEVFAAVVGETVDRFLDR